MNENLRGNYYRTLGDSGEELVWVRMTTAESNFAHLVDSLVADGEVPGPTRLNELMGTKRRNHLGGNYSKIRRAVFLGRGLRQDERTWKWYAPARLET